MCSLQGASDQDAFHQGCMGLNPTNLNDCLSALGRQVKHMKHDPNEEGRFSDHGRGLGTVTPSVVYQRAREIAVINGRGKHQILDSDIAEARRELLGEERLTPTPTAAESLPESKRWDPVGGSVGRKAPTVRAADEQTFAETLLEEGLADAEQDQALEGVRESRRRDSL